MNPGGPTTRTEITRLLAAQRDALEAIARRLDRLEDLILSDGRPSAVMAHDVRADIEGEREMAKATRERTAASVEAEVYGGGVGST